ncbi:MAG: tetratricopeptide repeat protein [Deinococcales bacterium]
MIFETLGHIDMALGHYDKALEHFGKALNEAKAASLKSAYVDNLLQLGRCHHLMKQSSGAFNYIEEALSLARRLQLRKSLIYIHLELSQIYKAIGHSARALEHYEAYHRLESELLKYRADSKFRGLQIVQEVEKAKQAARIYQLEKIELERTILELEETKKNLIPAHARVRKAQSKS